MESSHIASHEAGNSTSTAAPSSPFGKRFSWLPISLLKKPKSILAPACQIRSPINKQNLAAMCSGAKETKIRRQETVSSSGASTVNISQASRFTSNDSLEEEAEEEAMSVSLATDRSSSDPEIDEGGEGEEGVTAAGSCRNSAGNEKRRYVGDYELLHTLGTGMSGKVKLVQHKQSQEKLALKIIYKSKMTKRALHQLQMEVMALQSLSHPNILELRHVQRNALYPQKNGEEIPSFALGLELALGGELFDICMYSGFFEEIVARTLYKQLASALQYCHSKGIYHRDIKPENLLLDSAFQLKIADFGLSAIRSDPLELLQSECGTRSYMAPEILLQEDYNGGKADVYSSAVVLFILLAGSPPFQISMKGDWWFDCLAAGRYDRFWKAHKKYCPHMPDSATNFLNKVFQTDPSLRLSSDEVMEDGWINDCVLSPQALAYEMSKRKKQVEQQKEMEKEKALEQQSKKVSDSSRSSSFDPFMEGSRHRSVATGGDVYEIAGIALNNPCSGAFVRPSAPTAAAAAAAALSKAPSLPGGLPSLHGYTYFFSALPAKTLIDRLYWATNALSGTASQEGVPFNQLRCVVPFIGADVDAHVKVWSLPVQEEEQGEGVELHVIEVQRPRGTCPILYHRLFEKLKAQMESGLADASQEEEQEQIEEGSEAGGAYNDLMVPEQEELMTDCVDMI